MTHNDNLPYTSFFDKRSGIAERLTLVYHSGYVESHQHHAQNHFLKRPFS